jgi:hypothetical protein
MAESARVDVMEIVSQKLFAVRDGAIDLSENLYTILSMGFDYLR